MESAQLGPDEVQGHAAALLRLQHDAYAVEAALMQDDRIPPLHETEDDLVAAQLHWLLEIESDRIVGGLAYVVNGNVTEIDRLIVEPACHRRGIGQTLVFRILSTGRAATVSTGRANVPARRLYEKAGFVHLADREVLPGLTVSDYEITSPVHA